MLGLSIPNDLTLIHRLLVIPARAFSLNPISLVYKIAEIELELLLIIYNQDYCVLELLSELHNHQE